MEFLVKKSNGVDENIILLSRVFNVEYKEDLLHQLVVYYSSSIHIGSKAQKSRGEVRGGGIKPWKQKGTGRARVGSIRSPLWRGGGKIFAANGVSRKIKMNKKMYKLGMMVIFSELLRSQRLNIIDDLSVDSINTKLFLQTVGYLNIEKHTLFIVDSLSDNIYLSSRNLKYILVILWTNINPLILMKFNNIYITKKAIKMLEEMFK